MKKPLLKMVIIIGLLVAVVGLPGESAGAQGLEKACDVNAASDLCQEQQRTPADRGSVFYGPNGILTRSARLISIVSGVAAVVMIIISGFRFVTAGGDSNSISGARNAIIYAVIGIVIAAASQTLIVFVLNRV